MASHFSAIGFPVAELADFQAFARHALHTSEGLRQAYAHPHGRYVLWTPGSGIEVWLETDPDGQAIRGMAPHFRGASEMRLGLIERCPDPQAPHAGGMQAWGALADDADPAIGLFPLMVDLAAFALAPSPPAIVTAQVAAFAHTLTCWPSEDAYDTAQEEDEIRLAAEHFIPSGLFRPEGGELEQPEAHAILGGLVLMTCRVVNPATQRVFHHMLVRTLGGTVDIVADPAVVKNDPVAGGIATGSFWLSARFPLPQEA